MNDFSDIQVRPIDPSIFCAKTLAEIHRQCFFTPWSALEFNKLLFLPSVFGFSARLGKFSLNNDKNSTNLKTIANKTDFSGFALCSVAGEEIEIFSICVLPELRCKSLATNLMENVLKRANSIGVRKIFLEVPINNNIACNFYTNLGFSEFGRRKDYYREKKGRVDAIQFHKIIF